jgi:hypothetical protein
MLSVLLIPNTRAAVFSSWISVNRHQVFQEMHAPKIVIAFLVPNNAEITIYVREFQDMEHAKEVPIVFFSIFAVMATVSQYCLRELLAYQMMIAGERQFAYFLTQ